MIWVFGNFEIYERAGVVKGYFADCLYKVIVVADLWMGDWEMGVEMVEKRGGGWVSFVFWWILEGEENVAGQGGI